MNNPITHQRLVESATKVFVPLGTVLSDLINTISSTQRCPFGVIAAGCPAAGPVGPALCSSLHASFHTLSCYPHRHPLQLKVVFVDL